jgi:hypothetical protein
MVMVMIVVVRAMASLLGRRPMGVVLMVLMVRIGTWLLSIRVRKAESGYSQEEEVSRDVTSGQCYLLRWSWDGSLGSGGKVVLRVCSRSCGDLMNGRSKSQVIWWGRG